MNRFKRNLLIGFLSGISLILTTSAMAVDLRASLPLMPPLVVSPEQGLFVEFVKAIDDVYQEGSITISVYPFARSMSNVITGKADFHMPLLYNSKVPVEALPYKYSTETLFKVMFVLYTNKNNKEINLSNLNKFKIEVDRAQVAFFDFPIIPASNEESSFKKLNIERIDGYINAKGADFTLKKLGLKTIKRQEYGKYEAKFVLPKGERGEKIDRILSNAIKTLKETGKFQQILGSQIGFNSELGQL